MLLPLRHALTPTTWLFRPTAYSQLICLGATLSRIMIVGKQSLGCTPSFSVLRVYLFTPQMNAFRHTKVGQLGLLNATTEMRNHR